ncbi:Mycolic acid cyclopropane synthetase-domain-containing protein [Protomyces lactucae-debilis]|uniref:Mycolic acid cyclopropane synthetase-domain-containing protein n=1 Tax=Protomyces lactucae-debilis TaxID=2754530 RepID=A0A1Y2FBX7_PROLT|nr:Mycolic acid cyclopropane synthetase-domain-containing protein [Protomyces lactucae-debilis]ORY81413.1 Mycolic acid cyclopropane synthetase-domain-containing protein [Protomyces lactucae-debilis]
MDLNAKNNGLLSAYDSSRNYLVNKSWGPLVNLARNSILSLMKRITVGKLRILSEQGVWEFGDVANKEAPLAELQILNETFWVRLLMSGDLGFAEAYMVGDVACPDLVAVFRMFIDNRENLNDATTYASKLFSGINFLMNSRFVNSVKNAINNISAHYDLSNDMFSSFLSKDMTYSCGIFENKDSTLYDAQMKKIHTIIEKARIQSTDHVLEIGSGWGSFAIAAVKKTGCRVTTLTLSVEQQKLARERIALAGLTASIDVKLCDYRNLPVPENAYDKIVSIEMIEAVGKEYLSTYFSCVDKLLKKEGGIAVFQVITMPETRYERYCSEVDFIRRWIFPGGHLPTVTTLVQAINTGSQNQLIVDEIINIGGHYSKTLRLWAQNFEERFEDEIKPALLRQYGALSKEDCLIFKRKFLFYFSYCMAGYQSKILGDVIITVARENCVAIYEGLEQ